MPFSMATPAILPLQPRRIKSHRCRRRHTAMPLPISSPCSRAASPLTRNSRALNIDEEAAEGGDGSFSVVTSLTTQYNDIVVIDAGDARVLLLDSSHNIHSILNKEQKWTGSYWDEFASLPAIIPGGPVALLGLGGGTAAHMMLELWPSLQIEGWEIDEILIDMAREYFGLSKLEKCTEAGGSLTVHIDDALSPSAMVEGGFAGIIVDLFSDGKILPQLHEDKTWLELAKKLMPHGRIMVNCSGADSGLSDSSDRPIDTDVSSNDSWVQNSTIVAMTRSFPGEVEGTAQNTGQDEESCIMRLSARSRHHIFTVGGSGLSLPRPAGAMFAVHTHEAGTTEQLLYASAHTDQIRPPVPLQHVERKLCDAAGWSQYDAGSVVASTVWREGECSSLQKYS